MPSKKSALARAKKIKLILFDVDGVLTDGKIWIFPAPAGAQQSTQELAAQHGSKGGFAFVSQNMVEAKGFNAHDGTGFSLARLGGMQCGLITKRISETVALRARDLKLEHVYQGIQDKLTCFEEILRKENLKPEQAAFVGDDVIDSARDAQLRPGHRRGQREKGSEGRGAHGDRARRRRRRRPRRD